MKKDLIDLYKDGNQWCAIYPMGSNLMDCQAVEFAPVNIIYNENIGRERDYGRFDALEKLRTNNKTIQTSFHCSYWD